MTSVEQAAARPRRQRPWGLAVGIFLLAAAPRLAVVWSGLVPYAPDTGSYLTPAKNLAAGHGYVDDAGNPYALRPPTYPIFLAAVFSLTGESLPAVRVLQSLLAAAGAATLTLWVAGRKGLGTGATAGLVVALDPILVPVPAFVLSEALGTLLVIAIVIILDQGLAGRRRGLLAIAGFLGGAAALNTPITLLLVPWLLLTARTFKSPRRPDWRCWMVALGFAVTCVGTWTARNLLVRGDTVVIRDIGFASLVWATTEYDFDWLPSAYDPAWAEVDRKYRALVAGRGDALAHTDLLREAWHNFRNNPLLVLKRVAKANFWFWIEVPGVHIIGELRSIRWLALLFHQLQLLALSVALWALWRGGRLRECALWISTIVYFALFLSLMLPIPRYYIPLLPVMDSLIAAGLSLLGAGGGLAGGRRARPPTPRDAAIVEPV